MTCVMRSHLIWTLQQTYCFSHISPKQHQLHTLHAPQLTSPFIPLTAAGSYSAQFSVTSSTPGVTISVLWLRETTFALMGLRTFVVGPTATAVTLPPVSPPTDGAYHLQIEFGLAPVGTTLTFDDIQAFTTAPTTGGGAPTPPPPPPTPPPPPPPAGTPPPPTGGSVLAATSENFNGPAAPIFTLAKFGGADATVSFALGTARVTVVRPGAEQYMLHLKGPSIRLDPAQTYTIRVDVASSTAATPVVLLWLQEAPTIAPISPRAFAVGPAATTITLAGVAPPPGVGPFHVQVSCESTQGLSLLEGRKGLPHRERWLAGASGGQVLPVPSCNQRPRSNRTQPTSNNAAGVWPGARRDCPHRRQLCGHR
jgi:hypothetical protein